MIKPRTSKISRDKGNRYRDKGLDRKRQRKITNWPDHHRGHVTTFQHCLEEVRNAGHVEIVPHDLAAFNNYLQWFHESTRIELVKPAYDDDILYDPIEFNELAQSQHDTFARRGRSTSIASELNFVRSEIQNTAEECETVWDQSHTDDKPIGPMRHFIKNTSRKMRRLANLLGCRDTEIAATSSSEEAEIPEDNTILSQGIASQRKKQARRREINHIATGTAPSLDGELLPPHGSSSGDEDGGGDGSGVDGEAFRGTSPLRQVPQRLLSPDLGFAMTALWNFSRIVASSGDSTVDEFYTRVWRSGASLTPFAVLSVVLASVAGQYVPIWTFRGSMSSYLVFALSLSLVALSCLLEAVFLSQRC
ncbi:hypothetical protein QYE76_064785 [Lolium multiflorum]|uniref:Uncharacterized protein n=1 Tax=Lolium multiflorum TaxID=4521 RepID=A0AAD8S9M1_LOLMU|nr:hypothetical protein QYE76_064785 [Lolium multiflorum]